MRVRTAGAGVVVVERVLGTAVALATAAIVVAFFCFGSVTGVPLPAFPAVPDFGSTACFVTAGAVLPTVLGAVLAAAFAVALVGAILACAGAALVGVDFFAGAVFFGTGLVAAFFEVTVFFFVVCALRAGLAVAGRAGRLVLGATFFLTAAFAAAGLRGAAFCNAFLAGLAAFAVAFFFVTGAFAIGALAPGFFAEDFFAALATPDSSSVRHENILPQRFSPAFLQPVGKPGRNINHFHPIAQCRRTAVESATARFVRISLPAVATSPGSACF